jgi:predicted porin
MKKSLIALAALAAVSAASAQSSVTLSGNLDQAMYRTTQNSKAVFSSASNANTTSLWSMNGVEDLGNGLKAKFNLTSEITLLTGQTGSTTTGLAAAANAAGAGAGNTSDGQKPTLFNRAANIELESASFGTLTIGRQADLWFAAAGTVNNSGSNSFGWNNATAQVSNTASYSNLSGVASTGLTYGGVSGTGNPTNVGTAIAFMGGVAYKTPSFMGFQAAIQTSLGKSSMASGYSSAADNGLAYALSYNQGPIAATVARTVKNDANGDKAWTNTVIGGSYKWDAFTFIAANNKTKFAGLAVANHNMTVNGLGVNYAFNPTVDMNVSYTTMKDDVVTANKFNQTAVTARYKFSKRTSAYAGLGMGKNQGAARFTSIYGGVPTVAADAGTNANSVMVGLRHAF